MHFDFSALLVILTVVSGLIWAIDAMFFAGRRPAREKGQKKRPGEPVIVEYSRAFFPVLLLVLLFRSFLAEPFRIPSSSMLPTLLVGDLILVNKFAYGLRLPVLNSKFIELGEPERGDVVVFRFPEDPSQDYIKRVIGVPGDTIELRNRKVYVNGEQIEVELLGPYVGIGQNRTAGRSLRALEYLPGETHEVLIDPQLRQLGSRSWVVGENEYFVMGDNRDNSRDSRVWGMVPEENLVGKAFLVWMHWDPSAGFIRWSRIGNVIE